MQCEVKQRGASATRSSGGGRQEETSEENGDAVGNWLRGSGAHKWLKVELFDRSCLSLSLFLPGESLSVGQRDVDTQVPSVVLVCSGLKLLEGLRLF